MLSHEQLTISSTAAKLNTASTGGQRLTIRNTDGTASNAVDLGDSTVTAGAGLTLPGGEAMQVDISPGDELWAIRSTANDVDVRVLRT